MYKRQHGKGPCDGVGGSVKRLAARASPVSYTHLDVYKRQSLLRQTSAADWFTRVKEPLVTPNPRFALFPTPNLNHNAYSMHTAGSRPHQIIKWIVVPELYKKLETRHNSVRRACPSFRTTPGHHHSVNTSYTKCYSCSVGNETSDEIEVIQGVRRGCVLSFVLFSLYSEDIIIKKALAGETIGVKVNGRPINSLRFTDDTVLIAVRLGDLHRLIDKVVAISEENRLTLSVERKQS